MAATEATHEQDVYAEPVDKELHEDEDASDAQAQIIASLRSQVTDLFSQVTQLNGKLVKSYERVSDLEDQLHVSESSLRNASVTVSSLELERTHHLAALNTGLLVEKEHVTAELNRLMERATEEAAQRGQAETAKHDIEKELDDLSASLFQQANTMVAEARFGQAKSERKVREAEEALKGAEEAVKIMQMQMQGLQADKEGAERRAEEARISMGKGKWSERDVQLIQRDLGKMRLVTLHVPYTEFIAFVSHLRGLRISHAAAPAISSLLGQPFLARLLTEDSEPTVRLDLAPSLNWLSRRSVLAAIHTGMLVVEPVPFPSLLQELHPHSPTNAPFSISCALCGMAIVRAQSNDKIPSHPLTRSRTTVALTNGNSWFKNPLANSSSNQVGPDADLEHPEQVYVFRLAPATPAPAVAPASLPLHASSPSTSSLPLSRPPTHPTVTSRSGSAQTQQPYPLCTSNYCLLRLRSTCSLWAFVRTGVVERIWEEEPVVPHKKLASTGASSNTTVTENAQESNKKSPSPALSPVETSVGDKPPVLPRRRRLWEMASALGEKAVSWTETSGGKSKDGEAAGKLPPPPPAHPSAPHPHAQAPPPLPKRNEVRGQSIDTHAAVLDDADKNAISEAEKSNSQESFTTPVDSMTFALPSPVKESISVDPHPPSPQTRPQPPVMQSERPVSPHTVPLPETPTSPAFPPASTSSPPRPRERVVCPAPLPSRVSAQILQRPGSPLAPSRSRAGSPAPRASSRTASPAPYGAPPVPRRAPARRVVPAPPSAAQTEVKEREQIPMPSPSRDASSKAETPSKAETTDSAKEDKKSTSALDGQKGVVAGEGEGEEGAVEPSTTNHEPSENSKPFPDAGLTPAKQVSMGTPTHPLTESQSQSTTVDATHPAPEVRSSEDSSTHEKSIDTSSTKHSSSTDGEGYVGDATWEDRTWKEIVRLKEEMFWARVGGVR